jgi:hypothetical protein
LQALADASGTYVVSDVQTGTGPNQFGGWSILVAYRLPTEPLHALAIFDDPSPAGTLARIDLDADTPLQFSLAGLTTTTSVDVVIGMVAYEGDLGLVGDSVRVGTVPVGDPQNFFSSAIDVGATDRDPAYSNQYGFDSRLATAPAAFKAGDVALTVSVTSGIDAVFVGGLALSFPV